MEKHTTLLQSLGLLCLRVGVGGFMLYAHGWGKLSNFSKLATTFADPLGVGTTMSLSLAVFAEVFCALGLIVGLATRLAAIPLLVTMLTAAFVIHADDPWGKKEFALLYAIPCLTLIFTGPGQLSLDHIARKKFFRR